LTTTRLELVPSGFLPTGPEEVEIPDDDETDGERVSPYSEGDFWDEWDSWEEEKEEEEV
jgi:hypothetical protein